MTVEREMGDRAMGVRLESMAIEMPVIPGHPNRAGFRGVLTSVDVASDKPPAGARGHRVMLTRRAAEAAIPSLLGVGLGYGPALDRHDGGRKVGVITRAEIVGKRIEVGGFLYARDFPEIVAEIGRSPSRSAGIRVDGAADKSGRSTRTLGMSYEIADAQIEDIKAKVWVLNQLTFTGAAILRQEKAAYSGTSIELE